MQNTLDAKTYKTFKWQRNRLTLQEKAELEGQTINMTAEKAIQQKKESDKGRVRKLKVKVWNVITKPYSEQRKLLSPYWLEKFQQLGL